MLFNTRFWLVKVLLTPTIEKMIFSSAIYRLRLYFLSAAPGRPSRWFRAGRIRHHRAARRNDSDKDTTNFRIFGPCGGIIRLRAVLRIRRLSSHTGRGCRPEEGRGRAPPRCEGAVCGNFRTDGTFRTRIGRTFFPDSGFRPPDRMAASDRKTKIPENPGSFYAVSTKVDYKYFYYICGSVRILGVF